MQTNLELIDRIISDEINKKCDLSDWKQVRKMYGAFSFDVFLTLVADCDADPAGYAAECRYISEDIYNYINSNSSMSDFLKKTSKYLKDINSDNICLLYQNYLAQDFSIIDGSFCFASGKNHRDVIGAYYTSEKLAASIAEWSLDSWFEKNGYAVFPTVLDSTCGGGEFLIEVIHYYRKKGIDISRLVGKNICGFDVDPLAVLITRYRLTMETGQKKCDMDIRLGNPLCVSANENNSDKFDMALEGRYYSSDMGIETDEKYDVILGNPPWEKIRFEEKKFLKPYVENDVIKEKNKRAEFIASIGALNRKYIESVVGDYTSFKKNVKRHPLLSDSLVGELNTYALFSELTSSIMRERGEAALIVKASLLKMPVYKNLFRKYTQNGQLYKIDLFKNNKRIFPIDSREEFAVIYMHEDMNDDNGVINTRFGLKSIEDLKKDNLICQMSTDFFLKVNPDTGMLPNVNSMKDVYFLNSVYEKCRYFEEVFPDCRYGRLVHFTNHAAHIERQYHDGYIPVYEGKFIDRYSGKYATFAGMDDSDKYKNKANARKIDDTHGNEYPVSRYFIQGEFWKRLSKNMHEPFSVMWRSLTSATNSRTMIATILPNIPTSQSIQLLQTEKEDEILILALFNSECFDRIVRKKMVGLDMTQAVVKQMPVPEKKSFDSKCTLSGIRASLKVHIFSRIRKLYLDDSRLDTLFDGIEFYDIDGTLNSRLMILEIDQLVEMAYGL